MYESEKNEIVLKDEYKALYPVIGAGDEEDDGIFLKKHGETSICVEVVMQ